MATPAEFHPPYEAERRSPTRLVEATVCQLAGSETGAPIAWSMAGGQVRKEQGAPQEPGSSRREEAPSETHQAKFEPPHVGCYRLGVQCADSLGQALPVFLAGPTAAGKSAVALALAETLDGEIISVDSMQVYRGLDIGTAKPTALERARVPHHLLDVCDLHTAFDAAQFVRLAQRALAEIQARGRTPIFCGGTGFYFTAFLEGLGGAPPADEDLRTELKATPSELLLAELQKCDPATFETIDRHNPRRVLRAIEVIRLTGRKYSEQRTAWASASRITGHASRMFCLTRQPDDLRQRINARVDAMFSHGLVAETRRLLPQGLAENQNAMQAIGYRQVVEHLRGERGLAETMELVKTRTRQFAKRQLTWFRRRGNWQWLELKPGETSGETLARIHSLSPLRTAASPVAANPKG